MTHRKTFSKLLQLQRNPELMELTNALLMSLAFSCLSNVVGETAKRRENLRLCTGEHCLATCYIRIQIRVDKRVIHRYIFFMPYSSIGFSSRPNYAIQAQLPLEQACQYVG